MSDPRSLEGAIAIALLFLTGCTVDPFCLSCQTADGGGDAGRGIDGGPDAGMDEDAGGCDPEAAERCNDRDDDCDGDVDEDIDFMTSLADCGGCGQACAPEGAFGICMDGMCHIDRCDVGHVDLDMNEDNGCEYECLAAFDNDVICDEEDDDCDGRTDEDVMLTSDPTNCGACGNACTFPNAVGSCAASTCTLDACLPGFYDLDAMESTGCEYGCSGSGGAEVCNGIDDDCDGDTDEDTTPPPNLCRTMGECAGATAMCMGVLGFRCDYGPGVEVDPATGQPNLRETRCDDLDGNCNGARDESFVTLGNDCFSTGTGSCRVQGEIVCTSDETTVECGAVERAPAAEVCNGEDDDCDGSTDEPRTMPGTMPSFASVPWIEYATGRWMMQYEASRPDASASSQGTNGARACAAMGVLPWTNLRYADANAACMAAGARLCSETDFESACHGTSGTCTWAWQASCSTYSTNACNTSDLTDPDALRTTGTLPMCFATTSGGAIYDLSGNAKEFTAMRGTGAIPLRGGSYNQGGYGATCDLDWQVVSATYRLENTGFRCCFDGATPP